MYIIRKQDDFYKEPAVKYLAVRLHKALDDSKYLIKYQSKAFYLKDVYMKDSDNNLWLRLYTYKCAWHFTNNSIYMDNLIDSLAYDINKETIERWMKVSGLPIQPLPKTVCVVEDIRNERNIFTDDKHIKLDIGVYCLYEAGE
jgi:hypothetical protein